MKPILHGLLALALIASHGSVAHGDGNVLASLSEAGVLLVQGDEASNGILVSRTGHANEYLVSGSLAPNPGGGPTTVNGQDEVLLVGTVKQLIIRCAGGDDRVRVDGNQPGDVWIEGGPGDDFLALGCPVVLGQATLLGGPGNDDLCVQDSAVRGPVLLCGQEGDDSVLLFYASLRSDLTVLTGPGDDSIRIDETPVPGRLTIDAGEGDDTIELKRESDVGRELRIEAGTGFDQVRLSDVVIRGPATLDGGPGIDAYRDGGGTVFLSGRPGIRRFEARL